MNRRALAIAERVFGPRHEQTATALLGLGETLLQQGRAALAVLQLERAYSIVQAEAPQAEDFPETAFMLARALRAAGQDRHRAVLLAQQAHDALAARVKASDQRLVEVSRWLKNPSPARTSRVF